MFNFNSTVYTYENGNLFDLFTINFFGYDISGWSKIKRMCKVNTKNVN